MKVRSKEEFQTRISGDLAWRKKELTLIKSRVVLAKGKKTDTEIRSGIVMLYAHWEGYIKYCAECYLSYVKFLKLKYSELAPNLLALSIKSELNELQNCLDHPRNIQIINFIMNDLDQRAAWDLSNAIDTKSNLNSKVLQNILSVLGVPYKDFELKANLIDEQLLKNRNTIAHGNYLLLDEVQYLGLHQEILNLLDTYFNHLCNNVVLKAYQVAA